MSQVSLTELVMSAQSGDRLISFPTDTVPALAVRPDCAALIFEAKQRSLDKPLILMAANAAELWNYVQGSTAELDQWQQIAATYWPGALTLVLPASDRLPSEINPIDPTTIGLRVPNHSIARHILSLTSPLATTSVNRSGQPPLLTIAEINTQFPNVLTLSAADLEALEHPSGIDSRSDTPRPMTQRLSQATIGVPSTVVKWTNDSWTILRQGAVQFVDL